MDLRDKKHLGEDAEGYWYFAGKTDLLRRMLDKCCSGKKNRILVVGCGVGDEIETVSAYGRVTALDPEKEALRQLKHECDSINARIEETDFRSEYDIVVMLDVLEHIKDELKALKKVHSALKRGGSLLLTVPAHPSLYGPHDISLAHYRRYTRQHLQCIMEEAGFSDVRLSYWNSLLSPAIVAWKTWRKAARKRKPESDIRRMPWVLNNTLRMVIENENRLRERVSLPFGVTLVAVARK